MNATGFGSGLVLGLLLAAAILAVPLQPLPPGEALNGFALPAAAGLAVYAALRLPARWREVAMPALALPLFALPLADLWASGGSETGVIGGLLPWYDASVYHAEAHRVLAGEGLSGAVSRPLFVGLTAILLRLTRFHLPTTLTILWALPGLALVSFARVLSRTLGAFAGALSFALLFYFIRPIAGSLLTETLGLTLGALGFASLAATTAEPPRAGRASTAPAVLGMTVIASALAVRPGAQLVLPSLIVALAASESNPRRRLLIGLAACASPFLLSAATGRLLGAPASGLLDVHFAYSFYGVATGGTGWRSVFDAHPEVGALSSAEASGRVLRWAFAYIAAHPGDLVRGMLRSWADFFSLDGRGAFGFVGGRGVPLHLLALFRAGLWLLACRGAWRCSREGDRRRVLVLLGVAGIVMSVPFAPPRDAATRPYAATVPLLAWLVALGLPRASAALRSAPAGLRHSPVPGLSHGSAPALVGCGIFTVTVVASLVAGSSLVRLQPPGETECPADWPLARFHLAPGSTLLLAPTRADARPPLEPSLERFRAGLRVFDPPDVADVLAGVGGGNAITNTYQLGTGRIALVVLPARRVPGEARATALCVRAFRTSGGWLVLRADDAVESP